MKEVFKLTGVLFLICLISGALLAAVNSATKDAINKAGMAEKLDAIKQVLPSKEAVEFDVKTIKIKHNDATWIFYVARDQDKFVGAAVECSSNKGYSGEVRIMLGINAEDNVQAIAIVAQAETPGLGARMVEPAFKDQFKNKNITTTKWAVTKDQGDIDQITAATISSRAVVDAVKSGIDVFKEHKTEIINSN